MGQILVGCGWKLRSIQNVMDSGSEGRGFLSHGGSPVVTMGFNTNMVIHDWMIWSMAISGT